MPTLTFCCGAECGITSAGAAPGTGGVRHWNTYSGGITVVTTPVRNGSRAFQVAATGATVNLIRTITGAPTRFVLRFGLRFSSLPGADCRLVAMVPAAGSFCMLQFQASDSKIYAMLTAVGASGATVTTNTWYRVEMRGDVSSGTRTVELKVDGIDYGTASASIAASTFSSCRIGANVTATTATTTLFLDDIAMSQTQGDFPLGDGKIVGLFPNEDGTHNFSTAGDFQYGAPGSLVNVAVGATDVWTKIDDLVDNIGDVIASAASSNTEYLEVGFANLGNDVSSINGVEVLMGSHSAGTAANKQTLRLNDNGTLNDVGADLDQSQTSLTHHSKHYATSPNTGVAWTKTRVDALKARWNSSYGTVDNAPVPYCDSLVLEVDYLASSGDQTSSDTASLSGEVSSPVGNPAAIETPSLSAEGNAIEGLVTNADTAALSEAEVAQSQSDLAAVSSDTPNLTSEAASMTAQVVSGETDNLGAEAAVLGADLIVSDTESLADAQSDTLASIAADTSALSPEAQAVEALIASIDAGSLSVESALAQSGGPQSATDSESLALGESPAVLGASVTSESLGWAESAVALLAAVAPDSGSLSEGAVTVQAAPMFGVGVGTAGISVGGGSVADIEFYVTANAELS